MKIQKNDYFTYITPDINKHFSNLDKTEMYEGTLYLGKNDSPENYIEVTEEEYQAYLKAKEEEHNVV